MCYIDLESIKSILLEDLELRYNNGLISQDTFDSERREIETATTEEALERYEDYQDRQGEA